MRIIERKFCKELEICFNKMTFLYEASYSTYNVILDSFVSIYLITEYLIT